MKNTKVVIPATIEEATSALAGIDALLTAKGWERAGIVYAFTTNQQGSNQHSRKVVNALGIKEFAELGIAGLSTQDSVRWYRTAWEREGDKTIEPGQTVTLPDTPFPTQEKNNGSRMPADTEKAVKALVERDGADKVAEVIAANKTVRKPVVEAVTKVAPDEVGDVVSDDRSAMSAAVEGYTKKSAATRGRKTPTTTSALDAISVLTELPVAIDKAYQAAEAVTDQAEVFAAHLRDGVIPDTDAVAKYQVDEINKVIAQLGVAKSLIEIALEGARTR